VCLGNCRPQGSGRQAYMDVFTACFTNTHPPRAFSSICRSPGLLSWDALKARLEAKNIVRSVCLDVIPGMQDLVGDGAVGKV